jgi:hypothetical protein
MVFDIASFDLTNKQRLSNGVSTNNKLANQAYGIAQV